jgi:RecB family exonuclease
MSEDCKKHISYSAIKMFTECPNRYKLKYIDGFSTYEGNVYTVFGTSVHKAIELKMLDDKTDIISVFKQTFFDEYAKLSNKSEEEYNLFSDQGVELIPLFLPELKKHFGNFEVVAAEQELLSDLEVSKNFYFKGFVDLILKDETGKYHILDMKTCSWGWDAKKKSDAMLNYQLAFYKNFFAKMKGIPLTDIETHFVLLKRTAKNNKVEVLDVTCTQRRITNAFKVLDNCIINVERGNFPKNKLSCEYCQYYKKECK